MRLFIAIEFPEAVRDALAESAEVLRAACVQGNFSRRENYHLTLVFLGEVPPSGVKRVTAAMDACKFDPIPIAIGEPGRFCRDGGDIFWRAVHAPAALAALQKALTVQLRKAGFAPEDRAFRPHLTLARQAVLLNGRKLSEFSASMPELRHTVTSMTLMRSDRVNGKLIYTPMYRVPD